MMKIPDYRPQERTESTVHMLPCSLNFDGSAPVSDYFKIKPVEGSKNLKESHFRGRALVGVQVPLPEGVKGIVVGGGGGSSGTMMVDGSFSNINLSMVL